ncbi:MAG: hypothetical protein ABI690_14805 [Chloroflexota bacterium]
MARLRTQVVLGMLGLGLLFGLQGVASAQDTAPTRYLAFQMFTGAPDTSLPIGGSGGNPLSPPPSKAEMSRFVGRLIQTIGITGQAQTKLAFIIGPLAFDHSDAQLRQMIQDAFAIALEQNIAVGFHIDDSMFWAGRTDLLADPANIEWLDWAGTLNTGRRLDWGAEPARIAPQMCLNSPAIQAAVRHLGTDVIGSAVRDGIATLEAQGKPELFAGVIAGWETQIGRDFETDQYLGYCALTHRGFSAEHPPQDIDSERDQIVQEFIELWTGSLAEGGVDPAKIYSHTALTSTQSYKNRQDAALSYSQINQFAPPSVAFGEHYHPGFSTYPQPGLMEQLDDELAQHNNPAWASSEGANIILPLMASPGSMETYLAKLFNHGAALVNIFGWGIGSAADENPFRAAAEAPDSISAYQKFLNGGALVEGDFVFPDLPSKIQLIQTQLPLWLQQNPDRQSEIESLLHQLDESIKAGQYQQATKLAEDILAIISP